MNSKNANKNANKNTRKKLSRKHLPHKAVYSNYLNHLKLLKLPQKTIKHGDLEKILVKNDLMYCPHCFINDEIKNPYSSLTGLKKHVNTEHD